MKATWWGKFTSRHWLLTVSVLTVSTIALFDRLIDGEAWAMIVGTALGSFRAGDAMDTWVREGRGSGGHGQVPDNPDGG